jgi:hypothetical protein
VGERIKLLLAIIEKHRIETDSPFRCGAVLIITHPEPLPCWFKGY